MHPLLEELATEFRRGHISRRELIWRASGVVGGTALTSFLAACGAESENAPTPTPSGSGGGATPGTGSVPTQAARTPASGTPKDGGTFTMAIIADPVLNPLISSGVQSVMVNKVLFNGLTRPEPGTLKPVPDLAESWEANTDFTEWTFVLRRGVTWHDGQPFSADDVVFTYDRRMNEEGLTAAFKELQSVEKIDDHTVKFVLSEPLGHFPTLMSYLQFIVPKHILEGKKQVDYTEFSKKNPIGTGPYMIEEFNSGNYVSTKRNPNFYFGAPHIERFVFKVLPDVNTQVAQLRTGELTFATVEPVHVESLKSDPNLVIDPIDYVNHYYIAFQILGENTLVGKPLFEDPRVRLALSHAIDRQAIVDKVLLGYGTVATGTIPTALGWAYNDTLSPTPFDKEKCLALLAEAGWTPGPDGILQKDGEPLKFTLSVDKGNPAREQTATIVQQMFKDVGCDVTLETMDWASFSTERWLGEKYDSMHMWWITPPDPDQFDFYGCDGDDNHPNFCNPEMTEVLLEARRTADPEKRKELYFKFQEMEMEDPPVATLYYPKEIRVYPQTLQNVPNIGIRDVLIYSYDMWFDE